VYPVFFINAPTNLGKTELAANKSRARIEVANA